MCTILLAWQCVAGAPVVLAANRDELVQRPSAPPGVLSESPVVLGGRDLVAGGTWLAVALDGRLCAVTNRRVAARDELTRDPTRRSRGSIPLDVLRASTDAGALELLAGLRPGLYNPVDVLYVSRRRAAVAHLQDGGSALVVELAPGPHVLTVGDVDDSTRAKDRALRATLTRIVASAADADSLLAGLETLLGNHESPSGDALDATCIHGDVYGTVSASTVVFDGRRLRYRHAAGRPCVTPFDGVAVP